MVVFVDGLDLQSSIKTHIPDNPDYALDLAWVLRNTVEAGVFFDGLDPVVDVLLPIAW